jgi:hypothetical protein
MSRPLMPGESRLTKEQQREWADRMVEWAKTHPDEVEKFVRWFMAGWAEISNRCSKCGSGVTKP